MAKKSFQDLIPPAYKGLQVNFCRTPVCEFYGLDAEEAVELKHKKDNSTTKPVQRKHIYMNTGVGEDESSIKCKSCLEARKEVPLRRNVFNQIKSNKAAYEEFARVSRYLLLPESQCPNDACPSNNKSNVEVKIKKAGKTKAGTQR